MRLKAQYIIERPEFPVDYKPAVMSALKNALTLYRNGEFFKDFYDGSAKMKQFCFSVGFPRGVKFQKDKILLPAESTYITVTYSTDDMKTGIVLSNSLHCVKKKRRPLADGNAMTLTKIYLQPEQIINGTQILVKTLSPIVVRVRDSEKRQYASAAQPDFEEKLREQLARRFKNDQDITEEMIKTFHILPVNMRKTVVLHFEQKIECSVGTAVLSGAPELLFRLYEDGLGTRCAEGFGLLELLQQK